MEQEAKSSEVSLSSSSINDAMHRNSSLRPKLRFSFLGSVLFYQFYDSLRNKHKNTLVSIPNFQFAEMVFNKRPCSWTKYKCDGQMLMDIYIDVLP